MLPKLLYISQGETPEAHLIHIKEVVEAGVQFVQLRLKNLPFEVMHALALEAQSICQHHGALLSINDHVALAKAIDAPVLHLGLTDTSVSAARITLPHIKIGGTANTYEDILQRSAEMVDYIGLGPFRHTTTKEKLSPILGLEGYSKIINRMKSENIHLPIYAIGGIHAEDITELFEIGVYGIAVSGSLTQSASRHKIINLIKKHTDVNNS